MLNHFTRPVVHFLKSEDGPTAVEYAAILVVIIILCIVSIRALGTATNTAMKNDANMLAPASGS